VSQETTERNDLIISYMFLRQLVGCIGTLLPVALIAGNLMFSTAVRESISGYYYTPMRNVFVGALCALGVFLIAYDGHDKLERLVTDAAGVCAVFVAFCPTRPPICASVARTCSPPAVAQLSSVQSAIGYIHLILAALTFVALALMALRFAKSDYAQPEPGALRRLRHELGFAPARSGRGLHQANAAIITYRACAFTILGALALAVASNWLPGQVKAHWHPLLLLEALAIFAFGLSWFVKGRTLQALRRYLMRPKPGRVVKMA
jgi:hypothetical protein